MVKEKAYAKINLTLNVLNKRDDGYHNLKSVMVPINLYDELSFELHDDYELTSNYNLDINKNIITKVFNIFKERYNIGNVKITLNKNIPTEAGMGGGSSDATATIRGLNKLFNLNLSNDTLEEIAIEVGSDTLFTLHSKPALVTSRGDKLEFINVTSKFYILLIKPDYGFSTKDIFSDNEIFNNNHNDCIINSLQTNNINEIDNLCFNSFETFLFKNNEFKILFDSISKYKKPHLTGSGSTLFVISDNLEELNTIKINFEDCFTNITTIL